jgi:hypothetical protein
MPNPSKNRFAGRLRDLELDLSAMGDDDPMQPLVSDRYLAVQLTAHP